MANHWEGTKGLKTLKRAWVGRLRIFAEEREERGLNKTGARARRKDGEDTLANPMFFDRQTQKKGGKKEKKKNSSRQPKGQCG